MPTPPPPDPPEYPTDPCKESNEQAWRDGWEAGYQAAADDYERIVPPNPMGRPATTDETEYPPSPGHAPEPSAFIPTIDNPPVDQVQEPKGDPCADVREQLFAAEWENNQLNQEIHQLRKQVTE